MEETSWLHTDEASDVAGSIRHALRCHKMTYEDSHAWKWFFLSLHSALQGACVCHVVTTASPLGAVTDQNARKWVAHFDNPNSSPPPTTYLMDLPNLLKKVRRDDGCGGGEGEAIAISDQELVQLDVFHKQIRNQFVHFEPLGWSIDVSGAGAIARLAARIVQDIHARGWAFRHLEDEIASEMIESLEALSAL